MIEANTFRGSSARLMDLTQRKNIALESLVHERSIKQIAHDNQTSRKFVSNQKNRAISAIEQEFNLEEADNDKVLFTLPVTKEWLKQCVCCLICECHSSFRGAIKAIDGLFNYQISLGSIFNIIRDCVKKATTINKSHDLSGVKIGAHDEIFQHNKPVLGGVDIPTGYCYLLSEEESRDNETWAIHLWDLEKQGFNPERTIADCGEGLRLGQKLAMPNTPCDADNFHMIQSLIDMRRFFRNRLASASSHFDKMDSKFKKARKVYSRKKLYYKLTLAKQALQKMQSLSGSVDILVSWMQHDVLTKAGGAPAERSEMFAFIVNEFEKLEKIHPHRIRQIRVALQNQCHLLLAFVKVLDKKFTSISKQFNQPREIIWKMCELQRCEHGSITYECRSLPLHQALGGGYEKIEGAVICAMETTERTSSIVENFNSRLRPYFFLRKEIGNNYLELLKFYLNHTPFLRSERIEKVGKSAAELLFGKPHPHWLELLGFKRFNWAA